MFSRSSHIANGHATTTSPALNLQPNATSLPSRPQQTTITTSSIPLAFLPTGPKSLPGISIRSFLLGLTLGITTNITILLIYLNHYLWRLPAFISVLSLFHYLEFDMTARYNTADAKVSSFLLFNNGWGYTAAHCTAMVECMVRWASFMWNRYTILPGFHDTVILTMPNWLPICIGVVLIVVGQMTRSLAMMTAGRSFNHIVQSTRKVDHVLVTEGVYAWSRHPSYFGFFWWGLGTQFLLGNYFCLAAYGVVLWQFFASRIMRMSYENTRCVNHGTC